MRMRKSMIAVAVAAVLPLAGAAVAGEGPDKMKHGQKFDTLDTNRDGKISKSEATADASIVFASADANGDGYLDASEYSKAHKSTEPGAQPYGTPETPPRDMSSPAPADTETPPK
jgi:hypothetical protein